MKRRVYFAMGLHFHQPVGNFQRILERAYQDCYSPFLGVITRYPDIKITFHFSGNLLDYFEKTHPEFLDKVRDMVSCGQVEIMGGGYYEPIFQAIPKRDRIGQIEMLSRYIETRFGIRPRGMWIPERVWSPELIADLHDCGMEYSILDDIHLIKSGLDRDMLYGYFMTKDKDKKIAIFPSNKTLRYIIPFKSPLKTIDYFKRTKGKKRPKGVLSEVEGETLPLFTYGDDGEKFGEWPWTHDWVYKKGWLDNFFKGLMNNRDRVETITFSEYLDSHPPLKEIQIPESSYEEMLEWSGGSWMNFLSRYPESNQMYNRMRYVSKRLAGLEESAGDRKKVEEARRELYKGQCNCAYWHGVFGGIYLHHLRSAVYEHLINADSIIDGIRYKDQDGWRNLKEVDFYDRARKAIIFEDKTFFISIDPACGGVIRELDYKPESSNLINTLTRHKEPYHKKILERINNRVTGPIKIQEAIKTMDEGIKKGIFYDRYVRSCLLDHFIDRDLDMEDFADSRYIDKGDFIDAPYAARVEKKSIVLSREGKVDNRVILVLKDICISSDTQIDISYVLKNKSDSNVDTFFGTEFNITMPCADSDRYSYGSRGKGLGGLDNRGSVQEGTSFSIKDSQKALGLDFMFEGPPEKIWYFPVETVSQSERAYDLSYQSSCIFPIWNIRLDGGEEIRFSIRWTMVQASHSFIRP